MSTLRFCPVYSGSYDEFHDSSSYEKAFDKVYKPLSALLHSHDKMRFSFFFPGEQLKIFKEKNPEFLDLLKSLVQKKQVEIIGGGYYNPIFPLLYAQDRSDQIEKLSLSIRQSFGRRPRGIRFFADCWDPSLISTLESNTMEYALLESSLIPAEKQLFLPVVMSDRGIGARMLLTYSDLVPQKNEAPCDYHKRLVEALQKVEAADEEETGVDRCIALPLDKDTVAPFLKSSWVKEFFSCMEEEEQKNGIKAEFALPYNSISESEIFIQSYIHACISQKIARWCYTPYERVETSGGYPKSIDDYLQMYTASRSLYNRMIHICRLIKESSGDKQRKKAAREKLLAAQNGEAYICSSPNEHRAFAARQDAYKNLSEAETLLREYSQFKEVVSHHDYNGDGLDEYVCRLDKYDLCISKHGGTVFELDVMKGSGNYADNMSRIKKYDKVDDNYLRGIFVDHIFELDEAQKYCRGEPCRNGLFSSKRYKESDFSSKKQEIQLEARTNFSTLDQPILLRKKFIVQSSGIQVQYILKNEGPIALKAKFAVETNLAELNLLNENYVPYKIEIVSDSEVIEASSDVSCHEKKAGGIIESVSALKITDTNANVSFVFTPNENSGLTYFPVVFKRRNMDSDILQNESRTFVSAFVWDVDLPAGFELERTISLAINTSMKKRKKSQSSAEKSDSQSSQA